MRITLISLLAALMVVSCKDEVPGNFDIHRLEGQWLLSGEQGEQIEEWKHNADSSMWGRGYQLYDNDTLYIEYLAIQPVNDTLSYLAKVRNENFGEIIRFPVVAQTTSRITFENPQHDFPRKIVYELRNDSALYVVVEGTEDGVKRSIEFDYKKMR